MSINRYSPWTTRGGDVTALADIDDTHLSRLLGWLERQPDGVATGMLSDPETYDFSPWTKDGAEKNEWITLVKKEMKRRQLNCPEGQGD